MRNCTYFLSNERTLALEKPVFSKRKIGEKFELFFLNNLQISLTFMRLLSPGGSRVSKVLFQAFYLLLFSFLRFLTLAELSACAYKLWAIDSSSPCACYFFLY